MKYLFISNLNLSRNLILSLSFILSLSACDFLPFKSPLQNTCKDIALNRLKHPRSYDFVSIIETIDAEDKINIQLNFNAWNDYKVPILHSISCQFQASENKKKPHLTYVKWNGRPIRRHELDKIRDQSKE